jgi:hypothetical protein
MSEMGMDISVVTDGETLWMKVPTGDIEGKSWIGMPADAVQGQEMGNIDSATGMVDALRGIGADIEEVGSEEVNGVDATHYTATVDIAEAIAAAPEANREEAETALAQLEAFGSTTFPIDVWVSDDGLPVRMVISIEPPAGGEATELMGDFEVRVQVDMTDFGTEVDIQPPDPSDVHMVTDPAEIEELMGGAGTGGLGADLELSND